MENEKTIKENLEQRWYEEAFTRANIVVFDQDRDLRYTRIFNPHRGFNEQAVIGRTDEELLPADDAAHLREVKNSVLRTGKPTSTEVRTTIKGELFFYSLSVSPKYDTLGNITGIACTSVDITPVKRAELALNKANANMHEFLESIPDAFISIDRDWRYTYVNKKAEHILGRSRGEIIGKDIRTEHTKSDKVVDRYQIVLEKSLPETFEEYVGHLGKWFDTRVYPSRDGVSIYLRDITEQKEIELDLRESEERFRKVFDSNMLAIAFWRTDGSLTEANQAFCNLIGVTPDDVKSGRIRWVDFTPPEILWRDQQGINEINATGVCKPYEKKFVHSDGHMVPILIGGASIAGERDQGVAFAVNLSEIKEADRAIRESENRFRGLVMASSDVLYRMSPDWSEMIQLNSAGFLTETLEPNPLWRQEYIHPDDLLRVNAAIDEAIRTKSVFELEHRVVRADGTTGWTFSRAVPMLNKNGEITEWFGAASDITDRKQAELALKESESRLKILNENLENIVVQRTEQVRTLSTALTMAEQRERKRFSYTLHEGLQQKLFGARILFNEHLSEHESESGKSIDYDDLKDGITVLDNALQITKNLALELNPPILKTEGLDAALRWLETHMQRTYGLHVELKISNPLDSIKGDVQILITQMTRELLKNVVKHSGVFDAEVDVTCNDNQIIVNVKDGGRGFDVNTITRTASENKIGLFTIRERLNLLGGHLQIDSLPGKGTKCTIVYPYQNCQEI